MGRGAFLIVSSTRLAFSAFRMKKPANRRFVVVSATWTIDCGAKRCAFGMVSHLTRFGTTPLLRSDSRHR